MYKIRSCKICGQKINVRTKGKLLQIKNRCNHFDDKLISMDTLNNRTIPIERFTDTTGANRIFPRYCITHKAKLSFICILRRNIDLYHCPQCAIVDKMMSKQFIRQWKKRTWNEKWHPGDVKMTGKGD